jgi:hypothetical protein
MDKDVVVNLEGVTTGSLSMHKPIKTPHGLIVVANHGRRPTSFKLVHLNNNDHGVL